MKDCWMLLGIRPGCSADEIRRAFAAASRKHHPEEDPVFFMKLQNAYREAMLLASPQGSAHGGVPLRTPSRLSFLDADGHGGCEGEDGDENGNAAAAGGELDFSVVQQPEQRRPQRLRFPAADHGQGNDGEHAAAARERRVLPAEDDEKPLRFPETRGGASSPAASETCGNGGADEDAVHVPPLHFPAGSAPETDAAESGEPLPEDRAEQAEVCDTLVFPLPIPLGTCGIPLVFPVSSDDGVPSPPAAAESPMVRELDGLRGDLLARMQAMAGGRCTDGEWLQLTGGCDFNLLRDDPLFLDGLHALFNKSRDKGLCAALYASYGLSSARAPLRCAPWGKPLVRLLDSFTHLPVADIPHEDQAALLERCSDVLGRIRRLCGWTDSSFLWQQYGLTEEYRRAGWQPCFIMRAFSEAAADERLLPALQSLYAGLAGITPFLPDGFAAGPQAETEPLREYSRFLLSEDRDAFYAASAAELLDLFARTQRHFRFSGGRSPWENVFGRSQFAMLRHEPVFMRGLASFILGNELPDSFFRVFAAAYAETALLESAEADAADALRCLTAAVRSRRSALRRAGMGERLLDLVRRHLHS